jgi:hypothetical protein
MAARIFGIALQDSASAVASDSIFTDGPLAGKSVNIRLYVKAQASWISLPTAR